MPTEFYTEFVTSYLTQTRFVLGILIFIVLAYAVLVSGAFCKLSLKSSSAIKCLFRNPHLRGRISPADLLVVSLTGAFTIKTLRIRNLRLS
jgi:hypothetical protein